MSITSHSYGYNAELSTIDHYQGLGYKLLAHRYKCSAGEIDLIVKNKDSIVFIEVKARTNPNHEEFITKKQVNRCCATAEAFLAQYKCDIYNVNLRFDLAIVINGKLEKVIENAWSCES